MRITAKYLQERVAWFKQWYPNIQLYSAYGKHQIHERIEGTTGIRTISCLGTAREIDWFLDGLQARGSFRVTKDGDNE